jgi:hypothetical protein
VAVRQAVFLHCFLNTMMTRMPLLLLPLLLLLLLLQLLLLLLQMLMRLQRRMTTMLLMMVVVMMHLCSVHAMVMMLNQTTAKNTRVHPCGRPSRGTATRLHRRDK